MVYHPQHIDASHCEWKKNCSGVLRAHSLSGPCPSAQLLFWAENSFSWYLTYTSMTSYLISEGHPDHLHTFHWCLLGIKTGLCS